MPKLYSIYDILLADQLLMINFDQYKSHHHLDLSFLIDQEFQQTSLEPIEEPVEEPVESDAYSLLLDSYQNINQQEEEEEEEEKDQEEEAFLNADHHLLTTTTRRRRRRSKRRSKRMD